MFLTEYKGYDLTIYNDFLIECSTKDYTGTGTHKHHFLPKFMGGKRNKANVIVLSVEDHRQAHLILADCFPENSREYRGNIFGALYCQRWLEGDYEEISTRLSKIQKGRSQIGRPHTQEAKDKISKANKGRKHSQESIQKMRDSKKGFKHTEEHKQHLSRVLKHLYDTGQKVSITGPMSEEAKQRQSARMKECQDGSDNPFAKQIEHVESGRIFDCLKDAMNEFGFTNYNILNRKIQKGIFRLLEERPLTHENLKYGKKAKSIIHIESGRIFRSKTEARENMPISGHKLEKAIKEGKFKVL